ncbi:helix-turn-helix transcriptional regulator [Micromonospora sp. FIMYZ51]|uniref:helix-turn-helix domain-containing protein n=1 Tax=Micromonospora sp. FIMYZ51 TaxID=3051832 RepID=UPI00311FFE78
MSLLRQVIGAVLRRERQRQGLTLRELAQAAGVSVPYLSEVERGRKEASSEVLGAICRALGLYLSDLLEEVRDELRRVERRRPIAPRARYLPAASQAGHVSAGRRTAPFGFGTDGSTHPVARLHDFDIPSVTGRWLGGHGPTGDLGGSLTGGIRIIVFADRDAASGAIARGRSPLRLPAANRSRPQCRRQPGHAFCRGRICRRQNHWKATARAAQAG